MKFPKYHDLALLILRLTFGIFMIYGHGWGKIFRLFGDEPIRFADPFGLGPVASLALATFAEVVCAVLVALGLLTRWALIPLIITMFVATFIAHGDDPFGKMEKPFMYFLTYIALFLAGPGKYSLDALIAGKKS
ncbi:MAG TPA: DoxX family protein [Saprospiraceae bacterium]|nr:DoxX family protein [Saprospiraceae bacterium]